MQSLFYSVGTHVEFSSFFSSQRFVRNAIQKCQQQVAADFLASSDGVLELAHGLGLDLVDAVLDINDPESILLFAERQLAKKRLWTTAVLLEAFSNRGRPHADARFEAEALKCSALGELCKLLRTNDVAKKGLIAEVQVDWVASVGKDNVDKLLVEGIDQAKLSFASLAQPTESQQALKKQLDKIEKEMNQVENK